MSATLRRLFSAARRPVRSARLAVTPLEDRQVPAGSISLNAAGVLTITGTNQPDQAFVSADGGALTVTVIQGNVGQTRSFNTAAVKSIVFTGLAGDDSFSNSTPIPASATGGTGNDSLYGGSGNDTLVGGDGADQVAGGSGDDRLEGDAGADALFGGEGNDTLAGGDGGNYLSGDGGDDSVVGGSATDYLYGGTGNDTLHGMAGNDVLYGDDGRDWLWCEAGNDTADGGTGADALDGGAGDDSLTGGDEVGPGDNIVGGPGNDTLLGQGGDDSLWGDSWLNAVSTGSGNDSLDGGSGADQLHGGAGADSLYGGTGGDSLAGDSGNDNLFGGWNDGRDTLGGGAGADLFLQTRFNLVLAYVDEDAVLDRTPSDAMVSFVNGQKNWTDAEVQTLGTGLAWLQETTRSTRLLKLSTGKDVNVFRYVALPSSGPNTVTFGDNDSAGAIRITDAAFNFQVADRTIVHEMGHDWDTENPRWTEFLALSGWRALAVDQPVPAGYTRAADLSGNQQPWIYKSTAEFARPDGYGRTNPYEDFASSLETYYTKAKDPSLWSAKWRFIDHFLHPWRPYQFLRF